jgi:hypothetical protein
MLRILFLLLWTIPLLGLQARGDIEIYAHGHKYDSLQAYQASEEHPSKNHDNLSDATLHKLYTLSIENGMAGILQNFYQSWGLSGIQVPSRVSSDNLQEAIQQVVTASKDPKLLISEPGKMRIMGLAPESGK